MFPSRHLRTVFSICLLLTNLPRSPSNFLLFPFLNSEWDQCLQKTSFFLSLWWHMYVLLKWMRLCVCVCVCAHMCWMILSLSNVYLAAFDVCLPVKPTPTSNLNLTPELNNYDEERAIWPSFSLCMNIFIFTLMIKYKYIHNLVLLI